MRAVLADIPGVPESEAADIARTINVLADSARDLDDIFSLLASGGLKSSELAELLSAFESTLEQIRGQSDLIDGKLYDLSDRVILPAVREQPRT
ncbi:MAG: hypothetical protein ACRC33_10230 [Gemmataceae bacterium]